MVPSLPRRRRPRRRGVATIEFALLAPVLFLLILGLFQFVSLLSRQNVLTAAARDGARTASLATGSGMDEVIAAVEDRLSRGGISPGDVTIDVVPTSFSALEIGQSVTVTVSAPLQQMVWIEAVPLPDIEMSGQISYPRE